MSDLHHATGYLHRLCRYPFVGYLFAPGQYYDCNGEATERLNEFERRLSKAKAAKARSKEGQVRYFVRGTTYSFEVGANSCWHGPDVNVIVWFS